MKPKEFKKIWTEVNDNLNPISLNRLEGFGLSTEVIKFLTTVGLPDSAEPFISFSKDSDDLHNGIQKLTTVFDILEPEFAKYIVIGSCNDGDPIVINIENNNQIEFLDHGDYWSPRYFNSDLNSMVECLIAYRNFIITVQRENGKDALRNFNFTDEQYEKLKKDLIIAHSGVMETDGFWNEQIQSDLDLREEMRNEK